MCRIFSIDSLAISSSCPPIKWPLIVVENFMRVMQLECT